MTIADGAFPNCTRGDKVSRRRSAPPSGQKRELIKIFNSRMQMQIRPKSFSFSFFAKCSKATLTCASGNVTLGAVGFALRFSSEGERKRLQMILAAARVSLASRTLWLNPCAVFFLPSFLFLPFSFSKAACRQALPSAESRLTVSKFLLSRLPAFYL